MHRGFTESTLAFDVLIGKYCFQYLGMRAITGNKGFPL